MAAKWLSIPKLSIIRLAKPKAVEQATTTPLLGKAQQYQTWELIIDQTATELQFDEAVRQLLSMGARILDQNYANRRIFVRIPGKQTLHAYLRNVKKLQDKDKWPRPLNTNEIDDIVNAIPQVRGAIRSAAELAREEQMKILRAQLRQVVINPQGIEALKKGIVARYVNAVATPGLPAGSNAANSHGELFMQMTLDTQRGSGAAKTVHAGFSAISALLRVEKMKTANMTIHFDPPLRNYAEVYNRRTYFEHITFRNLIEEFDVISIDDVERTWWVHSYVALKNITLPRPELVGVLRLDVTKLYTYRITMATLVNHITESAREGARDVQYLICVASPLHLGIIYIYPQPNVIRIPLVRNEIKIAELSEAMIEETFLRSVVLPGVQNITLDGIEGIQHIYPTSSPIWSVVGEEQRLFTADFVTTKIETNLRPQAARTWLLRINQDQAEQIGVRPRSVVDLARLVGMTTEGNIYDQLRHQGEVPADTIMVIVPNTEAEDTTPGQYLRRRISDEERQYDQLRDQYIRRQIRRIQVPELIYRSRIVYAITNGSNLRQVMRLPFVDQQLTTSNDVNEIYSMYGVVAARNFIVRNAISIINQTGGSINTRHVQLLADVMTAMGVPAPVTYHGYKRQRAGPLATAAYEQAIRTFMDAGASGAVDDIKNVAASLYVGGRIPVGTGLPQVVAPERPLSEVPLLSASEAAMAVGDMETVEPLGAPVVSPYFSPAAPKAPTVRTTIDTNPRPAPVQSTLPFTNSHLISNYDIPTIGEGEEIDVESIMEAIELE